MLVIAGLLLHQALLCSARSYRRNRLRDIHACCLASRQFEKGRCTRGASCPFAHGPQELGTLNPRVRQGIVLAGCHRASPPAAACRKVYGQDSTHWTQHMQRHSSTLGGLQNVALTATASWLIMLPCRKADKSCHRRRSHVLRMAVTDDASGLMGECVKAHKPHMCTGGGSADSLGRPCPHASWAARARPGGQYGAHGGRLQEIQAPPVHLLRRGASPGPLLRRSTRRSSSPRSIGILAAIADGIGISRSGRDGEKICGSHGF